MPRYIIKLGGKYLEWSTIVDAPITDGMNLAEFTAAYLEEYGSNKAGELKDRLKRVEQTGTSSISGYTLQEVISGNRAGPNETSLSETQLIEKYCKGAGKRG